MEHHLTQYQMMLEMGWYPWAVWAFSIANLLIFFSYAKIGYDHFVVSFRDMETTLNHIQYGLFILGCGIGHLFMAWHMFINQVDALIISHGLTAIVSIWAALWRIRE